MGAIMWTEVICMKPYNTAMRLQQYMKQTGAKQVDILNKVLPVAVKYSIRIGKPDISQYVSGKVEPKQDKIFVLARGLNVSEAWLMGYDVPMERDFVAQADSQILSPHEMQVMQAYRNKPTIQPAVDKLLDVIPEKETAPSEDGATIHLAAIGKLSNDEQMRVTNKLNSMGADTSAKN